MSLSKHHLVKNAGITAALSGVGAVSGLVLDALVVFAFGVGYQTDALFAALTIPTLLNSVVSVQSPKIIIPLFSALFDRNDEDAAWDLLRNLLTTCSMLFVGVALAGVILSGLIIRLEVPGLTPDAIVLAVSLSRILFLLVSVQGLASILQSILLARHSYLVSSVARLVINTVTIAVVLVFRTRFGIQSVAWGAVLGSFVHVGLLGSVLAVHGFRYHWTLRPADPRLRSILGSFGYPFAGHVLGESGVIVQNVLGSFLDSGSLTVLRYASRIVQAIAGILLGSVVQVTLPIISRHAAAKDVALQRKALLESIQLLSLVGLPLCVWLSLLAEPLVALFFQRGQFTAANVVVTAVVIRAMVPDLFVGRLVSVSQTLFYANSDLRTPLVSTVIYTIANTVTAIALTPRLGVLGIGMAVSVASLCNAVYMIVRLHKRFGPVGWIDVRPFALRLSGTSLLAGVAFLVGSRLVSMTTVPYPIAKISAVAIPSAVGFSVFGLGVLLFRLFDTRVVTPLAGPASSQL